MAYPHEPVTCPCNHIFDRNAIHRWLARTQTCPISRQPLTINQLRPEMFIQKVLRENFPETLQPTVYQDEQLQDEEEDIMQTDMVDEEDEEVWIEALDNPFPFQGNDLFRGAMLAMISPPDSELINLDRDPEIGSAATLSVSNINTHFRRTWRLHSDIEVYGYINKYQIDDTDISCVALARRWAQAGYYIYRIQIIPNQPFSYIWSLPRRRNGELHTLQRIYTS